MQKVVLAYSGGLDTSIILAYLIELGYEVIAFMADVGQEEDFKAAEQKAYKIGASKVYISDLKKTFISKVCWPAIQCNAKYENVYYLGTALARPIIAAEQIRIAKEVGAFAVSHGCTGKGNDQVRFELAYYSLMPEIKVIAPWRDQSFCQKFKGRSDLLEYAELKGIPVSQSKAKPWSCDENLAHISFEAGILEDPDVTPPKDMFKLTVDPMDAPDKPEDFELEFEHGKPSKLTYRDLRTGNLVEVIQPLDIFLASNGIARRNGIGRLDIVENRFIGLKSRGVYETPGLTILQTAHIDLEGLTLDRDVRELRDQFISRNFAKLIYNGMFFSPSMNVLKAAIPASQVTVNGKVRLRAYKGNIIILGRSSDEKLYDAKEASMDQLTDFDPSWAEGFIRLVSLPLKKGSLN